MAAKQVRRINALVEERECRYCKKMIPVRVEVRPPDVTQKRSWGAPGTHGAVTCGPSCRSMLCRRRKAKASPKCA